MLDCLLGLGKAVRRTFNLISRQFIAFVRAHSNLVFLWHKGRNFRAITGDCRLAAPINWFYQGHLDRKELDSFGLVFVSFSLVFVQMSCSCSMIFTSFVIRILLPFGSTADISFSLCTAASSSDSRLGRLLPTLSMSANRPLLLLLLLEGLSCWSVLIEGGMGLREFWVPLYIWFPGKQLGYTQFTWENQKFCYKN